VRPLNWFTLACDDAHVRGFADFDQFVAELHGHRLILKTVVELSEDVHHEREGGDADDQRDDQPDRQSLDRPFVPREIVGSASHTFRGCVPTYKLADARPFKYDSAATVDMTFVIGRGEANEGLPKMHLGAYRALDGSRGADLYLDLDAPHSILVVGKRGYGKSYTLGVIAEGLSRTPGIAPTVVDPMGIFASLASESGGGSNSGSGGDSIAAEVLENPAVAPDSLDPRSWCSLLGLNPESGAGSLVWRAAQDRATLEGMVASVTERDAPGRDERAAINHLRLADSWGVFDAEGIDAEALSCGAVTVVDVSGLDAEPMNAVCRGIGEALYRASVTDALDRLPWLLVDEAHTFFDGVASSALETILTRGRAPGVSLVSATQRPSAVPDVGISQSDVLVSHRLTAGADLDALRRAQPTYMNGSLADRMPTEPGDVVIVDDATETVHASRIRERETPHGGESPAVSELPLADSTPIESGAAMD